jgi:hypothetical protein
MPAEARPIPHLDSPRQEHGDIRYVPLFPNAAARPVPKETAEERAARVIGNYQRWVQADWQARWSEVPE